MGKCCTCCFCFIKRFWCFKLLWTSCWCWISGIIIIFQCSFLITFSSNFLYENINCFCVQKSLERKAAIFGGGNFVVPVQTVTDFLGNKLSGKKMFYLGFVQLFSGLIFFTFILAVTSVPSSSYRLGVKAANLHKLFPSYLTEALQRSILMFENQVCFSSIFSYHPSSSAEFFYLCYHHWISLCSVTRICLRERITSWCGGMYLSVFSFLFLFLSSHGLFIWFDRREPVLLSRSPGMMIPTKARRWRGFILSEKEQDMQAE